MGSNQACGIRIHLHHHLTASMDFTNEPRHDVAADIVVHDEHPWNAEPPVSVLIKHNITPIELVYARNHCEHSCFGSQVHSLIPPSGPVKALDASTFKVKVDGLVNQTREFTLEELKRAFPKHEVVAVLQVHTKVSLPCWYQLMVS